MTNQEINAALCRIEEDAETEIVAAETGNDQAMAQNLGQIRERINALRGNILAAEN